MTQNNLTPYLESFLTLKLTHMKKLHVLLIASLLLSINLLQAQFTFEFVKDINPTGGTMITNLTEYNGKLYFAAHDGVSGIELFVTDGTAAGTYMVKDINTTPGWGCNPTYLTVFNNFLYFFGNDATGGYLWRTDGTANGTEIVSGAPGSYLTKVGNLLMWHGYSAAAGMELWASDGTVSGTYLVKDIFPGIENSYPSNFTVLNNQLVFRAISDPTTGEAIWISDGTAAGTTMLKDPNPNSANSYINFLTVFNGKIYFRASDGTTGQELWVSDGATAGTQLFKDINPGSGDSYPNYLKASGNQLFFGAGDNVHPGELWVTDGTVANTHLVKDINTNDASYPESLTDFNGIVLFRANNDYQGYELWRSDGTESGTYLLQDIYPGIGGGCNFSHTAIYNNLLYFNASDGSSNGDDLWVTNGTAGATKIAPQGNTTPAPLMNSGGFKTYNGSLYFGANYDANGAELWRVTTSGIGIAEKEKLNDWLIYPNPASQQLHVVGIVGLGAYTICSFDGRVLSSAILEDSPIHTIDISMLKPGVYLLTLNGCSRRFVKF
jgi:ELWxxDGT repeat protein